MEKYEVVEYWISDMQFGDALPFEALDSQLSVFSKLESASFAILLNKMEYVKFLKTRYWYAIRLHIYATRKACECCHKTDGLEVHHITYINHGYEHLNLGSLRLLCDVCHAIITLAVESMKGQHRA